MMTWQAVQSEVLTRIRTGQWPAGGLIPTETTLATEFGCARATINRALTSLAESGLLERRRKVGTRVAEHPPQQSTMTKVFIRGEIEARGAVYGYRLVGRGLAVPTEQVTRQLILDRGQPADEAQVIYFADDTPYCCELSWVNPEAAPDFALADLTDTSPHEWLSSHVALNHGTMSISATNTADLPEFVGEAFGVDPGAPVLVVERTHWANAVAVTVARQYFREGYALSSTI